MKLLACHEAAARRLVAETGGPIVLAGKSMGGRIGSHLAADGYPCRALVFLGYPLVAVGSNTPRSVEHLREIASPMLFITGSRDRLAPLDILRPVVVGMCFAEMGDWDTADDCAQEVFVRLHTRLVSLRDPAKFPAWLRTVIHHVCISEHRRPHQAGAG